MFPGIVNSGGQHTQRYAVKIARTSEACDFQEEIGTWIFTTHGVGKQAPLNLFFAEKCVARI